jgi:hypothetical protein
MNDTYYILSQIETPVDRLPEWEQFPQECQNELIQALAGLLLHLPQLQALEQGMVAQGAYDEQR